MNKAYKYRLLLNEQEKEQLDACFAVARKAWNLYLSEFNQLPEKDNLSEKIKICRNRFTTFKQMPGNEWMYVCPSRFTSYLEIDIKNAFLRFFKACKNGDVVRAKAWYRERCQLTGKKFNQKRFDNFYKPKFKAWQDEQSFRTDESGGALVNLSDGLIYLTKTKQPFRFKIKAGDKILKALIVKFTNFTFSRTKAGRYYVSIGIETNETILPKEILTGTGIDFGAKDMAAVAGVKVNFRDVSRLSFQIEKLQKKAAKKYEQNKHNPEWKRANYNKLQSRIRRLNERRTNIRRHETHLFTNALTKTFDFVAVEDLNVSGMTRKAKPKLREDGKTFVRNNKSQKTGLNRNILANNPSEVSRQLKYKQEWRGGAYHKVDRFFPSSKICCVCGHKNKALALKDREWTCGNCGTHHDRDTNAEINILSQGLIEAGVNTPLKKCLSVTGGINTTLLQMYASDSGQITGIKDRRLLFQIDAKDRFIKMLENTTLRIDKKRAILEVV